MVSRYSNELNSFRSGIEDRVSQHKDKIDAVNQALGIKADKVFENAKKISDIGSKLTEGGIGGGVGSTALAKYARKGITKFNTFKQAATDKVKGLADQAESKLQEAGSRAKGLASDVESKVGDLQDAAGNAESQVRQTAQNAQSTAEDAAQTARNSVVSESNTGGATQRVGATTEEGVGDTIEPRSLDQNTEYEYGDQAEAMRIRDAGGEGGRLPEDGGGETKGEDLVDDPSPSSGAGSAGGDVEMPTISDNTITASTADEATTESTLTGTAVDLEEDAAATSWLGFLGVPEILAGLGAIAGVAAAGVGIADAVKGGAGEAQSQAMSTKVKDTGFQAAGTYVVPTMDSVS